MHVKTALQQTVWGGEVSQPQRSGVAEPRAAPVGNQNPKRTRGARQYPGRTEPLGRSEPRGFSGVKVLRWPRSQYSVRSGLDLIEGWASCSSSRLRMLPGRVSHGSVFLS